MAHDGLIAGVKVVLRLCFVKLPGGTDPRIFRDALFLAEPEDRCYEDIRRIVERKLNFMEVPPADFTIFHTDSSSGDRIVVDDAYFEELISSWFAERVAKLKRRHQRQQHQQQGHERSIRTDTPVVSRGLSVSGEGQGALPGTVLGGVEVYGNGDCCSDSNSSGSDRGVQHEVRVRFEIEVGQLRPSPVTTLAAAAVPTPSDPSGADPGKLSSSDGSGGGALGMSPTTGGSAPCAPLTVENLTALMRAGTAPPQPQASHQLASTASPAVRGLGDQSRLPQARVQLSPPTGTGGVANAAAAETLVKIEDLVYPPQPPVFVLRCVPLDIRFKMPRAGVTVGEIDLCDASDARQLITAITFDASVQREMKEKLRCDGRQLIELRHVSVRRKNELDARYATNAHPLLLRVDRGSRLEVVGTLPVPITATAPVIFSSAAVAGPIRGGGVLDLAHLARLGTSTNPAPSVTSANAMIVGVGTSSSASSSTGPRRTTFTLGSGCATDAGAAAPTAVSGAIPSLLGSQLRQRQQQLLAERQAAAAAALSGTRAPREPGVAPVTARDVRSREDLITQHVQREEARVARIRRRAEVSNACILCGLDLSSGTATADADSAAIVRRLLEASHRNLGNEIPTLDQLRDALSDHRRSHSTSSLTVPASGTASGTRRLICRATFVNLQTRTAHIVHPRCAHLCTEYQAGGDLEDIAYCELPRQPCSLCGLIGACVACYHPDCREVYHVVCALYSGGYVNFGKRDPYLPCPACPRHTQVILSHGKAGRKGGDRVLHVDNSCWADGDIAFDSRVVADGDLRDPDENDGE